MAHRLEFSEFTFGFSLTENLMRLQGIRATPVFPSLAEEGTPTGGYDVALRTGAALPLFLQFKVPHVINRRSRLMPPDFVRPYYRVDLRCRVNDEGYSQHSVLLQHESNGHEVYYVSPRFHANAQLDECFAGTEVVNRSAFFRPSDVGPLTDEPHHVAYCAHRDDGWLRSEPVKLPHPISANTFLARMRAMSEGPAPEPTSFEQLLEQMVNAAERGLAIGAVIRRRRRSEKWDARFAMLEARRPPREVATRLREGRDPASAAAIFARIWLNSELFLLKRN